MHEESLKAHLLCHMNRMEAYPGDASTSLDSNGNTLNGFICHMCTTFSSLDWASMAKHLWRMHQIDIELHKCNQCEYRHYSLSYLKNNHAKIHSNEKNYACNTCSKKFKNSKQLLNHERRHVNRPEMSLVLRASVAEITDANQVHKNGRSYPCDKCNKSFIDARALRVHRNVIHKITRAFICSACGRSSASRAALKTHMRSHTGEKPFKCQECDYSTSDHNSLRRHKMRHSGERPYKCPFCTYACIQVSLLLFYLSPSFFFFPLTFVSFLISTFYASWTQEKSIVSMVYYNMQLVLLLSPWYISFFFFLTLFTFMSSAPLTFSFTWFFPYTVIDFQAASSQQTSRWIWWRGCLHLPGLQP